MLTAIIAPLLLSEGPWLDAEDAPVSESELEPEPEPEPDPIVAAAIILIIRYKPMSPLREVRTCCCCCC